MNNKIKTDAPAGMAKETDNKCSNVDKLSTDYKGRCGNCHKCIGDDEYCRYCGTKRGEGKFEPYDNFIPCVYGSPNTYINKCKKCGTEFQSSGMSVPRPSCCYKCGSSVTCEENNDFSNIQGLQRATLDNEFITADDIDNVTQDKTLLEHFICFDSMFVYGYTGDGKRAGGSRELIYNNDKRTVEAICNFYGESVEGGEKVLDCITVPTHIKFEEDLIEYIKSKKPEWERCLKSYQQKRKQVNPPLMGQIEAFHYPQKDKNKTFDPPPLADVPVYHSPQDFDPKDNIMPRVYGSPKQMSSIYSKKKSKETKNWLFALLFALGISICVILLILILRNL